jgi:hypothetical protein
MNSAPSPFRKQLRNELTTTFATGVRASQWDFSSLGNETNQAGVSQFPFQANGQAHKL